MNYVFHITTWIIALGARALYCDRQQTTGCNKTSSGKMIIITFDFYCIVILIGSFWSLCNYTDMALGTRSLYCYRKQTSGCNKSSTGKTILMNFIVLLFVLVHSELLLTAVNTRALYFDRQLVFLSKILPIVPQIVWNLLTFLWMASSNLKLTSHRR